MRRRSTVTAADRSAPMSNPVLVEVLRGGRVESAHRGAVAVVDADGPIALAFGDVDRPIFPRSAVKALQALPLIESGAADRLGLTRGGDRARLRLARRRGRACRDRRARCSRRPGSTRARSMRRALAATARRRLGRSPVEAQRRPRCTTTARASTQASSASPAPRGSTRRATSSPDHAVQRAVTAALADATRLALGPKPAAIDGCSIPTYAIPLRPLAHGFARFATGQGLPPSAPGRRRGFAPRSRRTLRWSAATGRFDTEVMALFGARVFAKIGAEGVCCAALAGAWPRARHQGRRRRRPRVAGDDRRAPQPLRRPWRRARPLRRAAAPQLERDCRSERCAPPGRWLKPRQSNAGRTPIRLRRRRR